MKHKPRIAVYYENRLGRNDGAPLYFLHALKRLEVTGKIGEVVHLIPDGNYDQCGKFDLHFWPDWGEDGLTGLLPYKPVVPQGKLAYFASDTHLGREYRFAMARKAKYVFFAQLRGVDEYIKEGTPKNQSVSWCPHAYEPACYRPGVWTGQEWIDAEPKKEFDVCFVGHMQTEENYNGFSRLDFLDRMFREFPNFYFGSRSPADRAHNLFDDAAKKFNQSKIGLNISIKDDINMRVFETLGTKTFLLTNWLPTFAELGLIDGVHMVTYKTLDEAVEKATYYLAHPQERDKIAAAGYELVQAHHTWDNRLDQILTISGIL